MTFQYWKDLTEKEKLYVKIFYPLGYLYWIKHKKNVDYFNAYMNGGTNGDTDFGGICWFGDLAIKFIIAGIIIYPIYFYIMGKLPIWQYIQQ
jgi:hypothetical protein